MDNVAITQAWLHYVLNYAAGNRLSTLETAQAIMRALEVSFGYRPPSGDKGPIALRQATQASQVGDTDASEVIERPPVHGETEGIVLDHRVQAAWDAVSTLPPIAFSEQEANALAAALARPCAAVGEREAAIQMLRDCADDLTSTASHHGQHAAIDQDKIDGLRDAVRDFDTLQSPPSKVERVA